MRVYLVRHATAEDPGAGPDSGRRLTDQGRQEAREVGDFLRARHAAPSVILTSPRMRARETAELVAAALDPRPPVEVRDPLSCGATSKVYWSQIMLQPSPEFVLIAHNPELSAFASELVGHPISFRPSTLCALDLEEGKGRLAWIRHPGQPGV